MTQNGLEREVIGGVERVGGKDGEVLVVGFGWLAQGRPWLRIRWVSRRVWRAGAGEGTCMKVDAVY